MPLSRPNAFPNTRAAGTGVGAVGWGIAVYVLGVVVTAYVIGRVEAADYAVFALFWPLLAPFALVFGALRWIAELGENHH